MQSIGQAKTRVVNVPGPDNGIFPDRKRFELLDGPIQGGMGAVFKAREKSLNRIVGIKRMLPKYAANPELTERFRREAEAMAKCHHPGLIQIFERNEDSGGPYIVMEWIDGADLETTLRVHGKMDAMKAAEMIAGVAQALQVAHDQGLIHRDIKPANILIDLDGNPHLTDFGIVRMSEPSTAADQLTVAGQILGTVEFMSPEQSTDPNSVTARSDLFSLAATLHRMISGVTLRSRDADEVPEWLREVLHKSLRSAPSERHQSAAEFERDLRRAMVAFSKKDTGSFRLSDSRNGGVDQSRLPTTVSASAGRPQNRGPSQKPIARRRWMTGLMMSGFGYSAWKILSTPEPESDSIQQEPTTLAYDVSAEVSSSVIADSNSLIRVSAENSAALQREWEQRLKLSGTLSNSAGIEFRLVPPGISRIGSPEIEEGHRSDEIARDFSVARPLLFSTYPVTQQQWSSVMLENPSLFRRKDVADLPQHPVENITWLQAMEFIEKINRSCQIPGWRYRLPTEAEWEYACRAGTLSAFYFGNALNGSEANCDGSFPYGHEEPGPAISFPTVVGRYEPNAWGLFDMHGNVWEWCETDRTSETSSASSINTVGVLSDDTNRTLRGGAWNSFPVACRSAVRSIQPLTFCDATSGLRVVCEELS